MPETAAAARTVALTGATGFIGARILQELTARGNPVRALTRRPQPVIDGVEWISGDLQDEAALQELVTDADAIIHCAGVVKARTAGEFDRVNNLGCQKLCQAVRSVADSAGGSTGRHFLLISSLAARMPELSAYAASKRAGEQSLADELADIPWTVMRPPGIYGPGDAEILKLLRAMDRGLALSPGSANSRFSLLHADDLAGAVCEALWQPEVFSKVVELDDGKSGGYSMDEVRQIVEPILDRKIRLLTVPGPVLGMLGAGNELLAFLTGGTPMLTRGKARELAHPDWVGTNQALTAAVNWQPEIDLASGLVETIAWYKEKNLL